MPLCSRVRFLDLIGQGGFQSDRSVLELGCGVGLTGMCLQRAKPGCLVLSDGNSQTLENCQTNLAINNIPSTLGYPKPDRPSQVRSWNCLCSRSDGQGVHLVKLDWKDSCSFEPDLVVGADLLYDTSMVLRFLCCIGFCLSRCPSVVG